jgi:hypothetical protein
MGMKKILKKIKTFVVKLLLIIVSLSITLIAGEVLVRLFTDVKPPLTMRHVRLGNIFIPGYKGTIIGAESLQQVPIRINREGFRGPDRPRKKEGNVRRIAVVGDSMIASINTREEDTLIALLEEKMNREFPDHRWEIFNFGVDGASTAQEFNLYREVIEAYDVDLVVCMYLNINDFSDNSKAISWNPRIYMDFDKQGHLYTIHLSQAKRISQWLNAHSRFYVWQKKLTQRAINNAVSKGAAGKDNTVRGGDLIHINDPRDETLQYSWKINKAVIQAFYDYVTQQNRLFLFVSIPDGIEYDDVQWQELVEKVLGTKYEPYLERHFAETRLKEILDEKNIPYLFLCEGFTRDLEANKDKEDYYLAYGGGRGHLNENGNRVSCDLLYDYLVKQGIVEKIQTEPTTTN